MTSNIENPTLGATEGEICNRDDCDGIIEFMPDDSYDWCCSCHINPPCNYCMSTQPECPKCGWRKEIEN